jgi:predicted permease
MPPSLQIFLLLFILGAAFRFSSLLTTAHAERLATIVFSFSLPATILVSLDQTPLTATAWKLPMAACLITLPLLVFSWQTLRFFELPRSAQGGFLLAAGCINSVYFAYPVVLATFGEDGLAHAVLFDVGQTALTLTVLYGIALRYGAPSDQGRSAAVRFFSSPPLWALAVTLGLKLGDLHLPSWLRTGLTPLHLTTTPLASLVLGLSIDFRAVRRSLRLAIVAVLIRMGGGFLLGLAAVFLLNLAGLERAVVMLVAGMPSAVTAVIFAAETGLDEELVASIVALSLCLGVALLPALPFLATGLVF